MATKSCSHCGAALREKGESPSFNAFWSPPKRAPETVPVRAPGQIVVSAMDFSTEQLEMLKAAGLLVRSEATHG
jgi:hypothetical protein